MQLSLPNSAECQVKEALLLIDVCNFFYSTRGLSDTYYAVIPRRFHFQRPTLLFKIPFVFGWFCGCYGNQAKALIGSNTVTHETCKNSKIYTSETHGNGGCKRPTISR